jgi:hypothetical protein
MKGMLLPRWVTDNARSLREEASDYVGLTPQERGALLAAVCRAGAKLLRARSDGARLLERTDPLPESSERALAQLRALRQRSRARSE